MLGPFQKFLRFCFICADLVNDFLSKNGPQLAAAVGYYALFSLIPLILIIMSLLGFLFGNSEAMETRLAVAVNSLVPVSGDTVAETLQVLARTKHVAGALGIVGLLWASTSVFSAIRKGINTVWGITRPRPFFHERFLDFSFAAGAGLFIVFTMSVIAGAGLLGEFTKALYIGSAERVTTFLLLVISPFISLIAFMFLYRYLPNTKVTFRDVWPGALLAAMAFEAAKGLFLWYTNAFPVHNMVYGPVGALIALLTWIYVSAIILFFGALVTSKYSAYMARKIEEASQQLLAEFKKLRAAVTEEND